MVMWGVVRTNIWRTMDVRPDGFVLLPALAIVISFAEHQDTDIVSCERLGTLCTDIMRYDHGHPSSKDEKVLCQT